MLQSLQGTLRDTGGTSTEMAGRGQGDRCTGGHQLSEGGGDVTNGVLGRPTWVLCHLSGSHVDPKSMRRILRGWACGGAVEYGGGDNEPPLQRGYHAA